ncbi:hypothetical protein CKM354_001059700 [Cercospora kikuchii]|uniref:SH3 domain-containing protein n=1 Tax=Cercospora kikuchii TaxID=84275 RepID=A0A9P3FH97_9PEZI|nr:uncharacterized protein CKM354_001059700 [Cercospora kikuchii]GIZ47508.1 hypothetical protein CKM354_001059700 [Cercospora kikuchii]
MRLLNISTLEFQTFGDNDRPPYAIASHRWEGKETTYYEMLHDQGTHSNGYLKVVGFCQLVNRMNTQIGPVRALNDLGLRCQCDWLWIDTACINKQDGAELSESINSMFSWYGNSSICYAYLVDVKPTQKLWSSKLDLMRSQWFKRGWTLQELLAPRTVVFVANDWTIIGHKCAYSDKVCNSVCQGFGDRLNKTIAHITGISQKVISMPTPFQLRDVSAAEKMSWAKKRVTTRPEDQAYCLLGLLDVFISPIYGEGENAWRRLLQALEHKQSLQTPATDAKAPGASMWLRVRGANREAKQEAHHVSFNTMPDISEFLSAPNSTPPRRPVHNSTTATITDMGAYPPTSYSVPPQGRVHSETTTISTAINHDTLVSYSVPPQTQTRRQAFRVLPLVPHPMLDPAPQSMGLPGRYWGKVEDEPILISPSSQLKHRYGSGWSFHAAEIGYSSQWFHELEDTYLSTRTKYTFQLNDTAVTVRDVLALYDFKPDEPGELAFKKGDTIRVIESVFRHWWKGSLNGRTGAFPVNYVQKLDPILDDSKAILSSESANVDKPARIYGPANISTLVEGHLPDVNDWLKHDGLSPGLIGDFQWQLLTTSYAGTEAEPATGDEVEALAKTPGEATSEATDSSGLQSPVGAQLGSKLVRDSVLRKRPKPTLDEQPVSPISANGESPQTEHVTSILAVGPPLRERGSSAVQGRPALRSICGTATAQPMLSEQAHTINKVPDSDVSHDDDWSSIQAEDFRAEHWCPPILARVTTLEQFKHKTNVVAWSDEPQAQYATATKHLITNNAALPPGELPETVSIPRIVLRALLEPRARTIVGASKEAEVLANTAVEYIRTLLLSQTAPQDVPQANSGGFVESLEIKTAKYEATSVTQMVSATATNTTKGKSLAETTAMEAHEEIAAG